MGRIPIINVRAALRPGQVPGCPSNWRWQNLAPCYGKILLLVAGAEAKGACGAGQLCAHLKPIIHAN
jgi:hypothetical protein